MPADFLSGFFTSDPARTQYGVASKLFSGAAWVPSVLTDPTLGGGGIRAWWTGRFDNLTEALDGSTQAKNFEAQARINCVDRIQILLDRIYDQANHPSPAGVERKDNVAALMNAFTDLRNELSPVMRAQDPAKTGPALTDLMNASFTAAMSTVASLENDKRGSASFDKADFQAVFNELFLRDRTMALSTMVGDLPPGMGYGAQDTPAGYMQQATANLIQADSSLEDLATRVSNFENTLGTAEQFSNNTDNKEAVLGLAINVQELGQQTQRLAAAALSSRNFTDSNTAANAAALSGVVAESMRGVLGVTPSGPGKLTSPPDVAKLDQYGRDTATKIGNEVTRERNQDPLYPRYDPAS